MYTQMQNGKGHSFAIMCRSIQLRPREFGHMGRSDASMLAAIFILGRHGEIIYKCHVEYLFGPMDTGAKIYAFVLYMIPCITTNILYIFVVLKVKMSVRRVHVINTNSNAPINSDASVSQTAQANKKIIRTVGLLLVTFNANIACMAVIIGTLFEPGFTVPRIFQSFALMNNVCNPFIYMTASSTFKNEIYKIILKLKC